MTTMEAFSSRFRRSRKNAAAPAPVPAPSSGEDRLTTTASRDSPSLLSTTASTAPPRSRSPLRYLLHPRSSQKRARSPGLPASVPQPASPNAIHHDGPADLEMTSPAKDNAAAGQDGEQGDQGSRAKVPPKMPAFLGLTDSEMRAKFMDLTWAERMRIQEGFTNPSPNAKFALVDSAFREYDRYANIQPWNNNRIKLQVPEGVADYINASPIVLNSPLNPETRPPHKYIAMQGPKQTTVEHVWRMIAEQLRSPAVIVMLTETHEGAMEKCYPYYPRKIGDSVDIGEGDSFQDGFRAEVKCVDIEEKSNGAIQMRKLNMHIEGRDEDMEVWHLLYKRWPDFGVPAMHDVDSFFELMRLSRSKNASEDNPRIIHCSAGVGRSGTFITLEHLIREIESGDLERYDELHQGENAPDLVYDTVNALREQRRTMVQAEPQFVFIYQVLRKLWMDKYGIKDESGDERAAKRQELDNDPFVEVEVSD